MVQPEHTGRCSTEVQAMLCWARRFAGVVECRVYRVDSVRPGTALSHVPASDKYMFTDSELPGELQVSRCELISVWKWVFKEQAWF